MNDFHHDAEMGPWRPTANQSLYFNPYSWTNITNMVFLSQPVDTGFSYATSNVDHDDINSAIDNVLIVKEFFSKFPERKDNIFYIAGESYGGHYIPQWTLLLFDEPDFQHTFKGFILGNPFTGLGSGDISLANTLWGLQLIPYPTWEKFIKHGCNVFMNNYLAYTNDCWNYLGAIINLSGDLNPYALTFPTCANSSGNQQGRRMSLVLEKIRGATSLSTWSGRGSFEEKRISEQKLSNLQSPSKKNSKVYRPTRKAATKAANPFNSLPDELGPERIEFDACTEGNVGLYLNAPDVREALHTTQSPHPWTMCSDYVILCVRIASFYNHVVRYLTTGP